VSKYQEISWLRIVTESVAIVGSILLAFAIDAWWQDRNELIVEQRILRALLVEFEENDKLLQQARDGYEGRYSAAIRLLADIDQGIDNLDLGNFERLVRELTSIQSTHLESGAYDSLIASGELNIVRDESLRSRLAAWPSYVDEWSEEEAAVFSFGEDEFGPYISEVIRRRNLANRFAPFPDGQSPPEFPVGPIDLTELHRLGNSIEFDNIVFSAAQSSWYAMRDGETLRVQLAMIVDLIGQNIDE